VFEEAEFLNHPKVKAARYLLRQAETEIRLRRYTKTGNHLCECGCPRKWHGPSYSINYTQGACGICDCLHFLMAPIINGAQVQ
jgi:hypothetical protein